MGGFDFSVGLTSGPGTPGGSDPGLIATIVGYITAVASAIWKAIQSVFNFLYGLLKPVIALLQHIWNGFFKKIFTSFFRGVLKLHDWLEAKLGPVIKFLKKVRAWYDKFYKQWVRPVLNTIQHIRRVLLILRALHIKWATALDRRLFDIESKIAGVFLVIRGHLNAAIDLLNLIVDPEKILRHPAIIIGVRRSIPGIFRAVTGMPIGFFFPSNLTNASAAEKPVGCKGTLLGQQNLQGELFPEYQAPDALGFLGSGVDGEYVEQDLSGLEPLDYFTQPSSCGADSVALVGRATQHLIDFEESLRQDFSLINRFGRAAQAIAEGILNVESRRIKL